MAKYLVSRCYLNETKHGKPYADVLLTSTDGVRTIINIWDISETLIGKEIDTNASLVQDAKGYVSFKASEIISINEPDPTVWGNLLPKVPILVNFRNAFEMLYNGGDLPEEVNKTVIDYYQLYCRYPASGKLHHSYIGGLAQHTYEVMVFLCRLVKDLAKKPDVDFHAIAWGALLHDYGKTLDYDENMDITKDMYLTYHTASSFKIVEGLLQKHNEDQKTIKHTEHIVLSHHGKKEFGSPVRPATYEAFMVHMADMMSSQGYEYLNSEDMEYHRNMMGDGVTVITNIE